jgi:hypothetical protein
MAYEIETTPRIPYDEYRAITTLMHAHLQTHEGKLRAIIAFGDIVTRGNTFDIDLLEIVEGWQGQPFVVFTSSAELPLRGELRLCLLTPEEFEHPNGSRWSSKNRLLDRVREGYDVVYEDPAGYARRVLAQETAEYLGSNPLGFLVSGSPGRQP